MAGQAFEPNQGGGAGARGPGQPAEHMLSILAETSRRMTEEARRWLGDVLLGEALHNARDHARVARESATAAQEARSAVDQAGSAALETLDRARESALAEVTRAGEDAVGRAEATRRAADALKQEIHALAQATVSSLDESVRLGREVMVAAQDASSRAAAAAADAASSAGRAEHAASAASQAREVVKDLRQDYQILAGLTRQLNTAIQSLIGVPSPRETEAAPETAPEAEEPKAEPDERQLLEVMVSSEAQGWPPLRRII